MNNQNIFVGILFFIGIYILIDTLITIVRIDVEQDIKEDLLRKSLMNKNMNSNYNELSNNSNSSNHSNDVLSKIYNFFGLDNSNSNMNNSNTSMNINDIFGLNTNENVNVNEENTNMNVNNKGNTNVNMNNKVTKGNTNVNKCACNQANQANENKSCGCQIDLLQYESPNESPVIQSKCVKMYPKVESGKVYDNANMELWKILDKVDNTKVGEFNKYKLYESPKVIKDTLFHGDKMMDTYRNDMVYKYDMDDKITNIEQVDPYDPVVWASFQDKKEKNIEPNKMASQTIMNPIKSINYVSKNNKLNPTPINQPILSDTHYIAETVKFNYIPPALHCDMVPSLNKVVSTNLISDNMLSERTGSYKVMRTNTISNDLNSVHRIPYDTRELTPQYNPLDNSEVYKVDMSRTPAESMSYNNMHGVCGFDNSYSKYTDIELNDLRETTSA